MGSNEIRSATGWGSDLLNVGRGILIGMTDVVPGVSGGTTALILGIYERLVTALSHVDTTFFGHLKARRWRDAAAHLDLRFLCALGLGIATGILGLASWMLYFRKEFPEPTRAVFFGLILAATFLVARLVEKWTWATAALFFLGAVFAYGLNDWVVQVPDGLGFLFLCGVLAICAMILPGISGAFVLVILGKYDHMLGLLRDAIHGRFTLDALVQILVFLAGCAVGLTTFCKLLRWLLARHHAATMATLCGIMGGSLRAIWPFQVEVSPRLFRNVWPETLSQAALACVLAALAGGLVLAMDYVTRSMHKTPELLPKDHKTPVEA